MLVRSLVHPLVNPLARGIADNCGGAASGFTDPTDISGLSLWLDATDTSTLWQDSAKTTAVASDGDPVGNWVDKSSNAHEFTQATAGNKPTYKTSIQNGLATLQFDGGDWLSKSSIGWSGEFTMFWVSANLAADGAGTIFVDYVGNLGMRGFDDTRSSPKRIAGCSNGQFIDLLSERAASTFSHFSLKYEDNTQLQAWLDGVSQGTVSPTAAHSVNNAVIGSNSDTVASVALNGYVGELIVYNALLSDEDRQSVESYLASRWGI